jgi:hypothetical protein
MAQEKELVLLVRYQFSPADLFIIMQGDTISRYKAEESVQNYTQLCLQEIKRLYPKADVEVIQLGPELEEDQSSFVGTYVEVWDRTIGEQVPDLEEPQIVDALCQRISDGFEWLVSRNRILVSQVQEFGGIPPTVLRWACHNGLVVGAEKSNGFWDFPLDQLTHIREQLKFVDRSESLSDPSAQGQVPAYCYLEAMADIFVMNLHLNMPLLVVLNQDSGNLLIQPNNSLFLIRRTGRNAEMIVEHFIDVERWSHVDWAYRAYVKALSSELEKQGIECVYQEVERNGKKEVDGISLRFSNLVLSQDTTMQHMFNRVLPTLSEVVNETELRLKGAPDLENQAYEQGEERFCKEVIEPLLNKMGFVSVRYIHGDDEYGRDFIFAEETPFNELRYYGLQAKRGKISGGARSDIDTILAQIEDSFAMPYTKEPKARSEIYISTMIIAISGEFTRNAIEKIRHKMPAYLVGSVYFWDKPKIRSLISQYWGKEKI